MIGGGNEPNQLGTKKQSKPGGDFNGPVCSACHPFISDIEIDSKPVDNHTSEGQGSTLPMQRGEILVDLYEWEKHWFIIMPTKNIDWLQPMHV